MCGIAGCLGPDGGMDADALVAALRHRGPDGQGVWQGEGATLVHTRLAILDLSEAGDQPMLFDGELVAKTQRSRWSAAGEVVRGPLSGGGEGDAEEGSEDEVEIVSPAKLQSQVPCGTSDETKNSKSAPQVLVFNGEIYNHAELRAELQSHGETFAGHSDTEVLLRLLVREGGACLPKLAGMFAFAFWDEARQEALLARDAYGIKPLYYREDGDALGFASEARVLKKPGDGVDATALRDFFLWGSVPEPATLNQSVRQLPAGHLMRWKNGEISVERWHGSPILEPRFQNPDKESSHSRSSPSISSSNSSLPLSRPEAVAATRAALEESVRRHLVSDVPVGIFLSGGIDSTVVLALTRQAMGRDADIRTFSIGFNDPAFDESSLARRTAEHFGARHTEWKMTPEEGAAEIPAFLAAADQPSVDGFNTWCVSELARREGMKVVMSGLGGDEFFAGYASFERVPKFHRLYRQLGPLRGIVAAVLSAHRAGSPWRRLGAFLRGGGTWLEAFHAQRGIFTAAESEQLAHALAGQVSTKTQFPALASTDNGQPTTDDRQSPPRVLVSEMEVTRYMRNQLLRDSDVFSMAHGLELRVPLVDVRLGDALLTLPPAERLRQGKLLLLDAVPEIPDWVRNQAKRGFRFPFQQWMEGQFGDSLAEARRASPVTLNAWYRIWAVAVAMRAVQSNRECI